MKIAVFIDFDNIEIGVKTTLAQHFDVGTVLEAIKERGEVVTKIAYGDWTRAGDYGRAMSNHAIHMVQRNLTPGGDKNGADINLALDALEMAFTHNHINTFVIVGGDSDFISLVEKLKQYDRKVFVVGGRAFTSVVMQKNCSEFIAYENLIGRNVRPAARGTRAPAASELSQALPLVRRALKLLADREVVPQLGLLKSTLLQLDSAFSERDYGASSFRDFVQKLANAGYVTLKGTDRSFHVELKEGAESAPPLAAAPASTDDSAAPGPAPIAATAVAEDGGDQSRGSQHDGYRVMYDAFVGAAIPRWPLYVRQVRQVLKSAEPPFDERRYGFNGIIDALRFGQREGLFRVDRDRMGVVRVYPGPLLQRPSPETTATIDVPESDVIDESAPSGESAVFSPGVDDGERAGEPLAGTDAGHHAAADAVEVNAASEDEASAEREPSAAAARAGDADDAVVEVPVLAESSGDSQDAESGTAEASDEDGAAGDTATPIIEGIAIEEPEDDQAAMGLVGGRHPAGAGMPGGARKRKTSGGPPPRPRKTSGLPPAPGVARKRTGMPSRTRTRKI